MPSDVVFPAGLVHLKLGPGAVLTEPLFYPELSRLATNRAAAVEAVRRSLTDLIPRLPTGELIRRRAAAARLATFTLTLDPPRPTEAWRTPVGLRFHAVVWEHGPAHVLARAPTLGIEVIAAPKDDLESAYPGRSLRFLENLQRDGPRNTPISAAEVYDGFTRETGLPRPLIDAAVPLNLEDVRRWFAARVVGQAEAVDLVVDLLATVKAGLARPNRPVASLLFIGPTGVGKTESAEAVARTLFGDTDRLLRFDLNEFNQPGAAARLVGTFAQPEGLLTAASRSPSSCSTRWRRPTRRCSTCCRRCSARAG